MGWELTVLLFIAGMMGFALIGVPIAFSFLIVNLIAVVLIFGPVNGPNLLVRSIYDTLSNFSLVPIPLFVLMGEILFRSGLAPRTLDAIAKWLGAIPGRLGILAIASGVMLATLSGSALATTALLGSLLIPEMVKRGYSKRMSVGPILGAGALAMLIPPSAVAILVGTLGDISIGRLLIGGIMPGILLALGNVGYIVVHSLLNPSEAPRYEVEAVPWSERMIALVRDILPLTSMILIIVGSIFLGIATPTEAAALGVIGAFALTAAYRALTWETMKESLLGTVRVSGMILLIMATAAGFSQVLSFTGATREMVQLVTTLNLSPTLIVGAMMLVVMILGCFMEQVAILMIVLPLFMPVVRSLGLDPVWFGLLLMVNVDLANLTPPFGLALFTVKGVAPPDFTFGDIIRGAIPFALVELAVVVLLLVFPVIGTWLPSLMFR